VLRWKRAEKKALRELSPSDKGGITPLLEMTERALSKKKQTKAGGLKPLLEEFAEQLEECWGAAPIFIDLSLLGTQFQSTEAEVALRVLSQESRARKMLIIPVIGLGQFAGNVLEAAGEAAGHGIGACVRLGLGDLRWPSFADDLLSLRNDLRLSIGQMDVIVDLRFLDGREPNLVRIVDCIPDVSSWRTFTLVSGAFTKDLSQFEKNQQHLLRRSDWLLWREQVGAMGSSVRRPAFGDYTIQHGVYSEPPGRANFSASIRYTIAEDWIIMRGEGVFNEDGPGFDQWPANALLLSERSEFCGRDYSYGDGYIWDMGQQTERPGSAETWLRAGINHHMAFAARQISSLRGI